MTQREYNRITAMLAVLQDVVDDGYGGKTIENVIQQLQSRKKEAEKNGT